jgi:ribonucleoside-diphosphate reductase alpha chain
MTKEDEDAVLLKKINPDMVEESVWSPGGTDLVVSFPVISKETSIYKKNLLGVKQLEYVKKAQQYWVEYGTRLEACVDQKLRHNISNTISVDDWDEVEEYLFENRQWFAGVSLLSSSGDKIYPQAPFTEVRTETEIVQDYGPAAIFASGLIVDGLKAFDNDLWKACSAISLENSVDESNLWKLDWVRRAVQFADRYFDSNIEKMTYCLKDCYNLHKWNKLQRSMKNIDFSKELGKQNYVDADTLASQGCAGGACEITF